MAKKLWRLVSQPQALVTTVLKEKYWETGNFLEAIANGHHSLIWKSLLLARDTLKLGLRWRVGNGEKIRI